MTLYPPPWMAEFGRHFTIAEVAALLSCSEDHVRRLQKDGQLEAVDIARRGSGRQEIRFSETSCDAFAVRQKIPARVIKPPKAGRRKGAPR